MAEVKFTSVLAPYMEQVVNAMRTAGKKCEQIIYNFKELDAFAIQSVLKETFITESWINEWKKSLLNDSGTTIYLKYVSLIKLLRHMSRRGQPCYIPKMPRQPQSNFTPYVFSDDEMTSIFNIVDNLRGYNEAARNSIISLPALIRLLYSSGLRISEALSIKNRDVNLDERTILLKMTKNGSERIIALSDSMEKILKEYIQHRNLLPIKGVENAEAPLFVKLNGTPLKRYTVLCAFHRILMKSGIRYGGRDKGPNLHSLRHTYATHSLLKMWREGVDLYTALPFLSTSLGHKSLSSTEEYLHLLKMYYPEIEVCAQTVNTQVFPKTKKYED